MTKFKIIALTTVFFTDNFAYAQFGAGHEWKDLGIPNARDYKPLERCESRYFVGVGILPQSTGTQSPSHLGHRTSQIGVLLAR